MKREVLVVTAAEAALVLAGSKLSSRDKQQHCSMRTRAKSVLLGKLAAPLALRAAAQQAASVDSRVQYTQWALSCCDSFKTRSQSFPCQRYSVRLWPGRPPRAMPPTDSNHLDSQVWWC
jgi:hypothetical protein